MLGPWYAGTRSLCLKLTPRYDGILYESLTPTLGEGHGPIYTQPPPLLKSSIEDHSLIGSAQMSMVKEAPRSVFSGALSRKQYKFWRQAATRTDTRAQLSEHHSRWHYFQNATKLLVITERMYTLLANYAQGLKEEVYFLAVAPLLIKLENSL